MSWHGRRRDGYHHGNLRDALVTAALDLLAKKGPTGFTFAEAARAAGVSAAAPYRHYRDRDDLMAEVARRGFELFASDLSKAWNEGRPTPLEAFYRMGKAYLTFARKEHAYYIAMFESQIPHSYTPELQKAADGAFGVLREAAAALAATLPPDRRPPSLMMSLHIWSMAHGIASLFGRGDEARRSLPMEPEELLEAGVLIYLDGLGFGKNSSA